MNVIEESNVLQAIEKVRAALQPVLGLTEDLERTVNFDLGLSQLRRLSKRLEGAKAKAARKAQRKPRAKITEETRRRCIELRLKGLTLKEISEELNWSTATVCRYLKLNRSTRRLAVSQINAFSISKSSQTP